MNTHYPTIKGCTNTHWRHYQRFINPPRFDRKQKKKIIYSALDTASHSSVVHSFASSFVFTATCFGKPLADLSFVLGHLSVRTDAGTAAADTAFCSCFCSTDFGLFALGGGGLFDILQTANSVAVTERGLAKYLKNTLASLTPPAFSSFHS